MAHRIALLVSGASGMLLPRHFLGRLAAHPEVGNGVAASP